MIPTTMQAVLLTGHGGLDRLALRDDVPVPRPGPGEVLIRVGAAAVNNTDINTRIAWYSKDVDEATGAGGAAGLAGAGAGDASWAGRPIAFPRIQGIDVCGRIVAVGAGVDGVQVGARVLVDPCLRGLAGAGYGFLGSERDGGFAEYVAVPVANAHAIDSALSDVELASFPCAFATAEAMLARAAVASGERVLVTGASGGVGSAAVQLARRRGATVAAVTGADKAASVRALGAMQTVERDADPVAALGAESVDVVVDLVAGAMVPAALALLRRGGRYVVAGAIAGPLATIDVRSVYLKDLSLLGSTWQPAPVFRDLVGYIERGEVRPVVAATYPLDAIVAAQEAFLAKGFVGKIALVPRSGAG